MATEPLQEEISRYTRLLTPRGKQVINLAQTYSERLGVIHMEHLVFALVDLKTTITTRILTDLNISRKRLESALSKFDVPQQVLVPRPSRPPVRFSKHALAALRGAEQSRVERKGKAIRSRDLLVGVLSVSNCSVVQGLNELQIAKEIVEAAIADDVARQNKTSGKAKAEGTSPSTLQTEQALPPANVERIRSILIDGNEDEHQTVISEIAQSLDSVDYSELRRQLISDLSSRFRPEPKSGPDNERAAVRSWMASVLGLISPRGDSEVIATLRALVHPELEPNESVRFWGLNAFWGVTRELPSEVKLNDPDGSVASLADAFTAKISGQAPRRFVQALEDGRLGVVWGALQALRIVAFPSLVPLLCSLLARQKRERGNVIPYETLQSLTNPEIVELSAKQLITMLGSEEVANHVVYALLDSSHTYRRKFSRLLVYMPAEEIRRSLQKLAESRNDAVAAVARELKSYLEPTLAVESDEIAPVAGYISDSIPDSNEDLQDELGIKKDVKTLCSVLLAHDVKPPLAVGLFGDWGTGKSYFMQKMYWEIKDLSSRAAKASKTAYHSKVVQIRFNAWHYADASLWASLVSHIFDELAKEVSPAEDPEETKKKLLLQLESAKQARVEAEAEQKKAVDEKNLAEESLKVIRKERENTQVKLSRLRLPDLMEVLTETEQQALKIQLQDVLNSLGLPSALNSIDELNGVYRQAFTMSGRIQGAMLSVWRSANRGLVVLLLIVAVIFFPLASWGFEKLVHSPFTAALNAFITEAALSLAAVATPLKKGFSKVSQLLGEFEEKRNSVFEVLDEKRKEVSEQELSLRGELESLRAAEDAARGRVSDADAKVREIEQKLTDIREGRSLSRFLLERVQAEDYRKHLGLISVIRKDFERLDYLLTRGEEGLEKVGRIILYIDDLDRCPADKVVDVLQAIHLLLALPLFVAVVGVDLRWLLHSLDQQYTAFQSANNRLGTDRSMRPEWVTDPQNYLEKIFQIPFTLNPMQEKGYEKLISVLMPKAKTRSVDEPDLIDGDTAVANKEGEIRESRSDQLPEEVTSESTDGQSGRQNQGNDQDDKASAAEGADSNENRDLDPEALMIKEWERAFAARMFPFIPTPRAVKRFTNTYRILKAPLTAKQLTAFEGTSDNPGEFQAAMLLLGIATRFPREAMDLFPAIVQLKKTGGSWQTTVRDHMPITEQQDEILKKINLGNESFVLWAPFVARFTFEAAKAVQSPFRES